MRDLAELNLNEGGKPVRRPPPSTPQIAQFQSEFKIAVPDEYLTLLAYSNGGHPELDAFLPDGVPDQRYCCSVNHFYHLTDDREGDLRSLWWAQRSFRPILGEDAFVFAADGGGNQFFLDLAKIPGPVNVWFHDEKDLVVRLAANFEAFIDGLRLDPDAL